MNKLTETLQARGKSHGDFEQQARVTQNLKQAFADTSYQLSQRIDVRPTAAEAISMILHKLARIRSGNPLEPDHWLDIAGYATLEYNSLVQLQAQNEKQEIANGQRDLNLLNARIRELVDRRDILLDRYGPTGGSAGEPGTGIETGGDYCNGATAGYGTGIESPTQPPGSGDIAGPRVGTPAPQGYDWQQYSNAENAKPSPYSYDDNPRLRADAGKRDR